MNLVYRVRNRLAMAVLTAAMALPSIVLAGSIDAFTDELPPNPYFEDFPILFVDLSHPIDVADQGGLAQVLGGGRRSTLVDPAPNAGSFSAVEIYGGALSVSTDVASRAVFTLEYGAIDALNANLFLSSDAFIIDLTFADMDDSTPVRPVPTTITVTSGLGTPSAATASRTIPLIGEGVYVFAYADFAGADFSDVDRITIEFDASSVESVDFTLGPLTTRDTTVRTQNTTWGGLKARYR